MLVTTRYLSTYSISHCFGYLYSNAYSQGQILELNKIIQVILTYSLLTNKWLYPASSISSGGCVQSKGDREKKTIDCNNRSSNYYREIAVIVCIFKLSSQDSSPFKRFMIFLGYSRELRVCCCSPISS